MHERISEQKARQEGERERTTQKERKKKEKEATLSVTSGHCKEREGERERMY